MKNHYYSDYLDNDRFLEVVDKYITEYDSDFDRIKDKICREVSSNIYNAHGDTWDINDYLAQAKSLIDVLTHINETLNEEVSN